MHLFFTALRFPVFTRFSDGFRGREKVYYERMGLVKEDAPHVSTPSKKKTIKQDIGASQ